MLDFSSLETFARLFRANGDKLIQRRSFMRGAAATGLFPLALGKQKEIEIPDCPMAIVREKRVPALTAVVRAQIDTLWCGRQGDNACQVAREILTYADYLPRRMQHGINVALLWLDLYSLKHKRRHLHKLLSLIHI